MAKQKKKKSLKSLEKEAISATERATTHRIINGYVPKKDHLRLWVVLGAIIVVVAICFVSGIFSWSVKYAECGKPPTTVEMPDPWSGSSTGISQRPGDKGYGPGIGKTYECMSPEEKAGKRY